MDFSFNSSLLVIGAAQFTLVLSVEISKGGLIFVMFKRISLVTINATRTTVAQRTAKTQKLGRHVWRHLEV